MLISSFKNSSIFAKVIADPFLRLSTNTNSITFAYNNAVLNALIEAGAHDYIMDKYIQNFIYPTLEDFQNVYTFTLYYKDLINFHYFNNVKEDLPPILCSAFENFHQDSLKIYSSSNFNDKSIYNIYFKGSLVSLHNQLYPNLYPSTFNHLAHYLKSKGYLIQIGKGKGRAFVINFSFLSRGHDYIADVFSDYSQFISRLRPNMVTAYRSLKRDFTYLHAYTKDLEKQHDILVQENSVISDQLYSSAFATWH